MTLEGRLTATELTVRFAQLSRTLDDTERNVYIVAGVLGGVSLILLILTIVLFVLYSKQQKKMQLLQNDWDKWGKGVPPGTAVNPHAQYQPSYGGGARTANGY